MAQNDGNTEEKKKELTPREKALKEAQEIHFNSLDYWKLRAQSCEQKINHQAPMEDRTLGHEIHKILIERTY